MGTSGVDDVDGGCGDGGRWGGWGGWGDGDDCGISGGGGSCSGGGCGGGGGGCGGGGCGGCGGGGGCGGCGTGTVTSFVQFRIVGGGRRRIDGRFDGGVRPVLDDDAVPHVGWYTVVVPRYDDAVPLLGVRPQRVDAAVHGVAVRALVVPREVRLEMVPLAAHVLGAHPADVQLRVDRVLQEYPVAVGPAVVLDVCGRYKHDMRSRAKDGRPLTVVVLVGWQKGFASLSGNDRQSRY